MMKAICSLVFEDEMLTALRVGEKTRVIARRNMSELAVSFVLIP